MKKTRLIITLLITLGLLLVNVQSVGAFPPLPSSFSGTVKIDGANVPNGTAVTARINGVTYATSNYLLYNGDTVYSLDVPGEDSEVAGTQGGVDGDTIVFFIGSIQATQTGTWHSASNVTLNLTGFTSHTVTFNSNGGSGSMSPQTASGATALTLNSFTRTGYSFSGWNTVAGGGGTAYADGATYNSSPRTSLCMPSGRPSRTR